MISKSFSAELNLFRWVAALLVVLAHLRNILFVDYAELTNKTLLLKGFYFITGFGHEAVVIFFVISGFLVGGISAHKYANGRFDPGDFVIHRFSRIYIVLVPALIVGYLLDHIGLIYFNNSQLYTNSLQFNFDRNFTEYMDGGTWLGNLLMLQHISVNVYGSNGPLWSLSYEWWYYCLFFCAIGVVSRTNSLFARALYGIAIVLMISWLPTQIIIWFVIWLAGMVIAFSPIGRVKLHPWVAFGLFLAALVWSRFDHTLNSVQGLHIKFLRDFVLATGCFLLLTSLLQRTSSLPKLERIHRVFAEFSYTTYLVHLPILVFAVAVLNHFFSLPLYQQPTLVGFTQFGALLVFIYAYSYGFSKLTESHTAILREKLNRLYVTWRGSLMPSAGRTLEKRPP
jgi:peptidoglycan/LPS O-acetylase OafA/YrhL